MKGVGEFETVYLYFTGILRNNLSFTRNPQNTYISFAVKLVIKSKRETFFVNKRKFPFFLLPCNLMHSIFFKKSLNSICKFLWQLSLWRMPTTFNEIYFYIRCCYALGILLYKAYWTNPVT